MIRLYVIYGKYPWELGYPPYVEFDGIFPLILREIHRKHERDREIQEDYERSKREAGIRS